LINLGSGDPSDGENVVAGVSDGKESSSRNAVATAQLRNKKKII
jgi:hypothetical protein